MTSVSFDESISANGSGVTHEDPLVEFVFERWYERNQICTLERWTCEIIEACKGTRLRLELEESACGETENIVGCVRGFAIVVCV